MPVQSNHPILVEDKKGTRLTIALSKEELLSWKAVLASGEMSRVIRQLMNAFVKTLSKRKPKRQ